MRILIVSFLVAAPAIFAQARGGAVRSGAGVRRPIAAPVRVAPAPVGRPGVGPAVGVGPYLSPYPVYFAGYYPNPFYSGYATGPTPGDYGQDGVAYGYDPSQGYPAQGGPGQGYPTQGQGYPSVLVNPNYTPETGNPVTHVYSNMPLPDGSQPDGAGQQAGQPGQSPVIFLIAMKDHTIYPAIAYWVEEDTLNYITEQGVRNRVSLDLVDRNFSTQLNNERNIDFGLPPAALPQVNTAPQTR